MKLIITILLVISSQLYCLDKMDVKHYSFTAKYDNSLTIDLQEYVQKIRLLANKLKTSEDNYITTMWYYIILGEIKQFYAYISEVNSSSKLLTYVNKEYYKETMQFFVTAIFSPERIQSKIRVLEKDLPNIQDPHIYNIVNEIVKELNLLKEYCLSNKQNIEKELKNWKEIK